MNAVLLVSIILGISAQNIAKKPYTQKTSGSPYFYCAFMGLFAMLFFVCTSGGFSWDIGIIPYSLGFALSYMVCTVGSVIATGCGSLSLTALVLSYSLMIPAFYGLIFKKDPVSAGFIPGIILLAASLFLINKKDSDKRFNLKWVISIFAAFVGNGMCSVVQNMQQVRFDGAYKNEFMLIALLAVTVFSFVMFIIKDRQEAKSYFRYGTFPACVSGVFNGMVNLFVMLLTSRNMPMSLIFPLISSGGIVITYIVSRFYYKEKLTKIQFVGFVMGVASVIFLNI